MTPHYVFISPFTSPLSYLLLVLYWGSFTICILVSIYFYRRRKEAWWLAVALAFALSLMEGPVMSWHRGIPPLPFAVQTVQHAPPKPFTNADGTTGARTTMVMIKTSSRWNTLVTLMAIALTWAYVTEKKKRTQSPGSS